MFSSRTLINQIATMALLATVSMTPGSRVAEANEGSQIRLGTKTSEVMVAKLVVSDLRRSLEFYTQVVGLKEFTLPGVDRPNVDDAKATGQVYLNFSGSPADAFVALMKSPSVIPTAESSQVAVVCFKVADTRAAIRRAKEWNARVNLEPQEFMGAIVALVQDPDGYTIEFTEAQTVETAGAAKP